MKPKLIKTEAEHAAAMARIDQIFQAKLGTPEGDEFELLAVLVERYEKEHFPIDLPDPITAIKFRIEQQGLKKKDLVTYLGSQSRVSEVLSGKRALTVQMIRKLHDGLGIPMEVLIQEPEAKMKPMSAQRPTIEALKEMCARGYFAGVATWGEAKARVDELLGQLLMGVELAPAYNRQMLRAGAREDQAALAAWKARVLQRAKAASCADFEPKTFTSQFLRQLAGLSRLPEGPAAAVEMLRGHGVIVLTEPHLPGTHLDGAALLLDGCKPVIALTLRHDRLDNFWFCLFHELGHVLKHLAKGKADGFLDDLDSAPGDKCEEEADEFARDTLIPRKDWEKFFNAGALDDISVRREARRLLIDGSILAGRVRMERKNFTRLTRLVGQGRVRKVFQSAA
ncbi:MAG: ImmA/IrrE family metallo-endopeptidase [Verrucomicrobiota bacterium]|nr:ImmA/IrrE family metallo-endopeptidase [Verrucomicrobiota bacterium]